MESLSRLWENIKVALHLQERQQAAQQAQQQARRTQRREEREEKKEKAELIAHELQNVTPQHKAYELLKGVQMTEGTLSQGVNQNLANDILDMLKTTRDVNSYHDPSWLEQKRNIIAEHGRFVTEEQDIEALRKLDANLKSMLEKKDQHRRKTEFEKTKLIEERLPREEAAREKQRVGLDRPLSEEEQRYRQQAEIKFEDLDTNFLLEGLDDKPETRLFQEALPAVKGGDWGDRDKNIVLADRLFERQKKEAVKEIKGV